MANKDLFRHPHRLRKNAWWYEGSGGLEFYVQTTDGIKNWLIQWNAIRKVLARKDK